MIYTFGHEVTFTVNTVTMNKTQFEEYKRNQQGHAGLLFLIFTTGVMLALAIYVEWKGYFTW